jgi:hypothetical protein
MIRGEDAIRRFPVWMDAEADLTIPTSLGRVAEERSNE